MSDLSAQVRKALDAAVAAIGGAPREGQIEMAEAVANALTDRHHLMVQAGTGTGKSLAYLVPALVHGRKVLVATATLALQRQLVERDLPAVVPALEKVLGREITFGIYKGVGNYVCLQKMNSEDPDPDGEVLLEVSHLGKDAKRLHAWAKTPGVSGDRDDAPEVDRRVWAANSLSGRECVGADVCNYGPQCFAALAKAKAQLADVVVTNHTLLAIEIVDSHPILPERDAVILDEAHEFMDRTTQAVTEELTSARVIRAAAMARKHMPGKLSDAMTKAADNFHDAMADYGDQIRGDFNAQGRLEEIPSSLEAPIRKVREAAAAIVQIINADDEIIDSDGVAERARVKGAVNEINTTCGKLLKMSGSHVLWYEPTFSTLHLAPLSVSEVLRANLLTKTPVIATSATLTVGNGFDAMARSIGFVVGSDADSESEDGDIDPANVQMLDVGSPFDFANQGVLYMPKHLPEPGRDGPSIEVLTELGELIDAAGGRTLALFSSWRGVEAADALSPNVISRLFSAYVLDEIGDNSNLYREIEAEIYKSMAGYLGEEKYSGASRTKQQPRLLLDLPCINPMVQTALLSDTETFIDELTEFLHNPKIEKTDFQKRYDFSDLDVSKMKKWTDKQNMVYIRDLFNFLEENHLPPAVAPLSKFAAGIVDSKSVVRFLSEKNYKVSKKALESLLKFKETAIVPIYFHKTSNGNLQFTKDPYAGNTAAFSELLGFDAAGNPKRSVLAYCVSTNPPAFDIHSKHETNIYRSVAKYSDVLVMDTKEVISEFKSSVKKHKTYDIDSIFNITPLNTTEDVGVISTYLQMGVIGSDWDVCMIAIHHSSWQQIRIRDSANFLDTAKIGRNDSKVDLVMQSPDNLFFAAEGKRKYTDFFSSPAERKKIESAFNNIRIVIDDLYKAKVNGKIISFICILDVPEVDSDYFLEAEKQKIIGSISAGHLDKLANQDFVVIGTYALAGVTNFALFFSEKFPSELRSRLDEIFSK